MYSVRLNFASFIFVDEPDRENRRNFMTAKISNPTCTVQYTHMYAVQSTFIVPVLDGLLTYFVLMVIVTVFSMFVEGNAFAIGLEKDEAGVVRGPLAHGRRPEHTHTHTHSCCEMIV